MVFGHAKAKATYSFVIATTMLDLNTAAGNETVQQLHSAACQTIRKNDAEFDRLLRQAEKDKLPHVTGIGWAKSKDNFVAGFLKWLNSQGLEGNPKKYKLGLWLGEAEDPQSGLFDWCVFVRFELDK